MSDPETLRRRRAELAAYLEAARADLAVSARLAQQVPEFVARAREDLGRGSNVGLFASVKLLEDLYSSIEQILERTEGVFSAVPATREWHKDLLWGTARKVPDFRPPILRQRTVEGLDELLRFRHFGRRGSYRERIQLERVAALAAKSQALMTELTADLGGFWTYVEASIRQLAGTGPPG